MKDLEIEIIQATPWSRALNAARWTANLGEIDKEPSDNFKIKVLKAQHSPIRMVEYDIKITNIPYCVAVHFVRHHIGIEKFQGTLRDDRNELIDDRKKLPQNQPVNLWMSCNADALIAISRRRLCSKAANETRFVWRMVVEKMKKIDPIMAQFMVPECIYRSVCPETPCCGYCNTDGFKYTLEQYHKNFKC